MEVIEIKHEFVSVNRLQCRACLSVGRMLRPLRGLSSTYLKITSEYLYPQDSIESVLICWQCSSLLRKVVQFQQQVKRASELLQTNQSFLYGPLSNLTSLTFNDTQLTIYIYEGNVQTDKELNEDADNKNYINETLSSDDNRQEATNQYNSENDLSKAENDLSKAENDLSKAVNDLSKSENYLSKTENDFSKTEDDINKTENLDYIPVKKQRSKSRWAIKRAQQNKKLKFKVSTNFDETFKKVQISNEELLRCIVSERDSEYFKSKRFKCDDCVLGFFDRPSLAKHHQKLHSKGKKYTCDICKSRIVNKRHLLSHLSKHYIVYKCIVCLFVCRKEMRSWHFEREHKKAFQCLKCELQFGSRRVFFQHFKAWHEKFICDHCGVSFKMRYCIQDHIRKQHSPFECKPCGKTFARYNGLWLHNKLAHRPASPAYCAECDTHYPDIYRLKWHLCNSVRHAPRNKLRIPCPACDKIFTKKIYMRDHYNLVHLKIFKYRCGACDKNFIRNADLVKHNRKIHEGVLPPKNKICYICGRGFTTNNILHNHVRTHTGERPFLCTCGARYSQLAAMHAHARRHEHAASSPAVS